MVALLGMQVFVNLHNVEKRGKRFYAKGKDIDNNPVQIIMDKYSKPNLMANTYGYVHVLFIVSNGQTIRHNKYYSFG